MRELRVRNYAGRVEPIPISEVAITDVRLLAESTDEELAPCLEDGETVEQIREACRIDLVRRALGL